MYPVMITGLPRSGTTWFGKILSTAPGTIYIFEPDNEKISPVAWLYKKDVHRFPYLSKEDKADSYEEMWRVIFSGRYNIEYVNSYLKPYFSKKVSQLEAYIGERTGILYINDTLYGVESGCRSTPYRVEEHPFVSWFIRRSFSRQRNNQIKKKLIIKSVHTPLCMEWITSRFMANVVIVLRNPYAIYASYKRMRMPDAYRNLIIQEALRRDFNSYISKIGRAELDWIDHIVFQIMLMLKVLEKQIQNHPEWIIVSHDRLCVEPERFYKDIFKRLGLIWTEQITAKINTLNKYGEGYTPLRISKDQPHKWQVELNSNERKTIERWISEFALSDFLGKYVN